jgi:hypothetical protein
MVPPVTRTFAITESSNVKRTTSISKYSGIHLNATPKRTSYY